MSIENSVKLIGNLGNDVELKYTQAGMAVATISLATTSKRKDRDGNKVEETAWHRVKFFGKLAEIVGEYLRKGSKITVEGSIRYGKYTDKAGVERYTTDIIADQMLILDSKREGGDSRPARTERPQQAPPQADHDDSFADDDIGF